MPRQVGRALRLFLLSVAMLLLPSQVRADEGDDAQLRMMLKSWLETKRVPPAVVECTKDCYVLSAMSLRGAVGEPMAFELKGMVLADGPTKIPLFGPSGQVRLDDLSIDGAPLVVGFEDDHYFVITSARSFTLRGKLTLASDEMLTVAGPLVSLDAKLSRGRLVEGEKLSGLAQATLHFNPMTRESESEAESKTPKVFRLSRAVRFGKETTFVYRLVMSQATDLGTVVLPLAYGEKVQEVPGIAGWTSSGSELTLPTKGKDLDITITGVLAESSAKDGVRSFHTDDRSAYEWWLVESDPEHRVEMGGEGKLVDNTQSPIAPLTPSAHAYLLQRGQQLEVDAKSLVRGEVLAAVARSQKRFASVTARGEIIGDETIAYDNNGLDHLSFTPAGQPMYLSTDGQAGRILHTKIGSPEMLVPLEVGLHHLRVQSLSETRLWPFVGAISVPMSDYPLTTSVVDVTVGLPVEVHPIAVLGGDRIRWAFARADLIAALFGMAVACFGFRTRKTRALGSLATVGLWFVSRDAFVVATALLFLAGAVFLASRFLRGNMLLYASAACVLVSLFGARWALTGDATNEPETELFVQSPSLPQPESARSLGTIGLGLAAGTSMDTKAGITPVSLSMPASERYVQTSRQLVTSKRPFVPRVIYATGSFFVGLEIAWVGVLGMLVFAHRAKLVVLKDRVKERLSRRPQPKAPNPEAFPRF